MNKNKKHNPYINMKGCVFLKKISIILAIIITILCINEYENENIIIPNESIRIRIIGNSNRVEDQILKLKVKNKIEESLNEKLKDVKDIEEARTNIKNNINNIDNILKNTLTNNSYEINYGTNYFPEKNLYGVTYKEGNYESLVIKIGEAKGNNWWCVLFPPLCMIDAQLEENKENIEYKSKVLEIINKYQ